MIVNNLILEDIERRKRKLDERLGRVSLVGSLQGLFRKSIKEGANLHSCRLEQNSGNRCTEGAMIYEDMERWYSALEKKGKLDDVDAAVALAEKMEKRRQAEEQRAKMKEMKKTFKRCYANLDCAWKWGLSNFKPDFNEEFIIEIAKRIEPCRVRGLRQGGKMIVGLREIDAPPSDIVPFEIMRLMANVQDAKSYIRKGKMSPVELAVMAHYHIARIHPFVDGNGRTARMMQNLILNHYGYPAAIIHKGDKINYISNLEEAHKGYDSRKNKENLISRVSDGERRFYNYIASRINTSLDLVLDKVYKK